MRAAIRRSFSGAGLSKIDPVDGVLPSAGFFVVRWRAAGPLDRVRTSALDSDARPIELDLSGLKCPLPTLRTRKALRRLDPGAVLVVVCTDPLAGIDIPNLVREEGGTLLATERVGAALRFTLRRGPAPSASVRLIDAPTPC